MAEVTRHRFVWDFFNWESARVASWCWRVLAYKGRKDSVGVHYQSPPNGDIDARLPSPLAEYSEDAGVILGEARRHFSGCHWSILQLRDSPDMTEKEIGARFLAIHLCADNRMPYDYAKMVCLKWERLNNPTCVGDYEISMSMDEVMEVPGAMAMVMQYLPIHRWKAVFTQDDDGKSQ